MLTILSRTAALLADVSFIRLEGADREFNEPSHNREVDFQST
jgi:hypothetical protein